MKKLIVAIVAAAVAVCANAASYDWKTAKSGGTISGPLDSTALASGTAYLFLATEAETVFGNWTTGADWTAGALDHSDISAGKIATKTDKITLEDSHLDAIFAVLTTVEGTDYLYISTIAGIDAAAVGAASVQFKETTASAAAALLASEGYKGEGHWYAAPEPTSGLMMLLGMGVLALRRRRA